MIIQDEANVRNVLEALPNDQPGIALDIGANHGLYTDLLATKFAWVYAFEPDPDNMKVLQENVKSPNVTFIKEALGIEDNAEVKLYRSNNPGSSTTNTEAPRFGGWGHTPSNYVMVPTITLDTVGDQFPITLMHNVADVKFIKCDIEGAEDYIFEHGRRFLTTNRLTMILEVHQTVRFDPLYQLFIECDYKIFDILGHPVNSITYDAYYIITNEGI